MRADHPGDVAGLTYDEHTVIGRLRDVGCQITKNGNGSDGGAVLTVARPSWRPDLRDPNDLAEEVIRFEGYDKVGVAMPRAIAGKGRTAAQRLRRSIGQALAGAGYIEVISGAFTSAADFDRMLLPEGDPRRLGVRIANPLKEEEPLLRTTLLPGLFQVASRNAGRGFPDLSLFEIGNVARNSRGERSAQAASGNGGPVTGGDGQVAPILRVDRGPTAAEVAELEQALPSSRGWSGSCWPASASPRAGGAAAARPASMTRLRRRGRCCTPAACRTGSCLATAPRGIQGGARRSCSGLVTSRVRGRRASGCRSATPASCTRE